MDDSDVFVGSPPERASLVAKPWRFAAAVSLGLHAVLVAWIADSPTPIGREPDVAIDAVEVEFVVSEVARSVSPSIVGRLAAAGSQHDVAVPPRPATIQQTPGNGFAPESTPTMVTASPAQAPSVVEPPVVATPPDPAVTADNAPRERTRPDAGAPVDRQPAETSASAPSATKSAAETKRIDRSPPAPKPIASGPKQPAVKPLADGRAPKSGHHAQPKPVAPAADRTANLLGNPGQTGSVEVGQAAAGKPDALALYLASIRAWIAGQQSRMPGPERGRVEIRFSVAADGLLGNLKVEKSNNDSLDEEALKIVRRSSPVAPIPASTGKTSLNMSITIEFR